MVKRIAENVQSREYQRKSVKKEIPPEPEMPSPRMGETENEMPEKRQHQRGNAHPFDEENELGRGESDAKTV
jgi:hypothetical protein